MSFFKKGLLIYPDMFDALRALDDAQLGCLVKIAFDYVEAVGNGEIPAPIDFGEDSVAACNWVFVKQKLDAAFVAYQKGRRRAKAGAAARWGVMDKEIEQ